MKKILFLIAFLVASFGLASADQISDGDPTDIIIVRGGGTIGDGPRGPVEIPIQGVVFGGSIYLTFSSNLGYVDVSLEEAYSGLILQTVVDSSTLSAILPFSGDPGEYSITFSLSSGVEYEGSFVIN